MSDPYAPKGYTAGIDDHNKPMGNGRLPTVAQEARDDIAYIKSAAAFAQEAVAFITEKRDAAAETINHSDGATVDPVVKGLLDHLPRRGAVWPLAERKHWLELMEGSFKLIYKDSQPEPQKT